MSGSTITIRLLGVSDAEAYVAFNAAIPPEDGLYYLPASSRTRMLEP